MSRRLVFIRVGDANGSWATASSRNLTSHKWSTPESGPQLVRDAWIEGHEVVVLFLTTGDRPSHMGIVTGVRARNNEDDAAFPRRNDLGEFNTIMTFNRLLDVREVQPDLFEHALSDIRYQRGSQIAAPCSCSREILSFFAGSQLRRQNAQPVNQVVQPNVNATVVANNNINNATYGNVTTVAPNYLAPQ